MPPKRSAQAVSDHLLQIATRWPIDRVRTEHQFGESIKELAAKHTQWTTPRKVKLANDTAQSLERILANEANRKHPPPPTILKPKSYPHHYEVVRSLIAKAERGESTFSIWEYLKSRIRRSSA